MNIAVILPHTLLFGGVKHYLEVGETMLKRGHRFIVFSPEGEFPQWSQFSGEVKPLSEFYRLQFDVVITSEEAYLSYLIESNTRIKAFYCINQNRALPEISQNKDILFLTNSTRSKRHIRKKIGRGALEAFCGVNTDHFFPREKPFSDEPFVVFTYGRQSMRLKGTHLVKKACEDLYKKGYNIKLLLFDTITDDNIKADIESFTSTCPFEFVVNHPVEKNHELYHRASVFASAERKGTWANTASEAMACGVPVIASGVGSDDFLINGETGIKVGLSARSIEKALKKMYKNREFKNRAVQAGIRRVRQYQWRFSADHILALCERTDAHSMSESHWPFTVNHIRNRTVLKHERDGINQFNGPLENGVYIINYHSIFDPEHSVEWERCFPEGVTDIDKFSEHMSWLLSQATPVKLSHIPTLLENGEPDKPYFSITFDDGYSNVFTNAFPILRALGITATVFANGDFADQKENFVMVELAVLIEKKGFKAVASMFKKEFGISARKPKYLYRGLKESEQYGEIVTYIHNETKGMIKDKVHLDWNDLRTLNAEGWEIGNHTLTHANLNSLLIEEQVEEIEGTTELFRKESINYIPWLGIPYGSSEHVNLATLHWLSDHTEWYGLFANGGVNRSLDRTEMLRIGVGNVDLSEFKSMLCEASIKSDLNLV